MTEEKVKIQFNIPVGLKEWLREESEKMGLTMSAYVMILLYQAKEQKEVVGTMGELMKKLEEIEGKIE